MRFKGISQIAQENPLSKNPPATGNAKIEEAVPETPQELSPSNEYCSGICLYYCVVIGGLCAVIGMN